MIFALIIKRFLRRNLMKLSKGDILMASAACAWGFSYIFMKMGAETITPFQMTFLRFGFAFPVLLLIFRKKLYLIAKS